MARRRYGTPQHVTDAPRSRAQLLRAHQPQPAANTRSRVNSSRLARQVVWYTCCEIPTVRRDGWQWLRAVCGGVRKITPAACL